jgi:uncharacterized membrane protein YjgN (DUF898 family)
VVDILEENISALEETVPAMREVTMEFRGTGAEYFRIWIVNLLLTLVTLGIYSAWAKVRRLRYFYGSTSLDGSHFEYRGRPVAILKGRLIVLAVYLLFLVVAYRVPGAQLLLLPIIVLGLPWVIVRARRFQARMSSWRGISFDFTGTWKGAFAAHMGWMLLASLTAGVLWPMALWKQAQFQINHTCFGATPLRHQRRVGEFYRFCLAALGLMVLLVIAAVVILFLVGFILVAIKGPDAALASLAVQANLQAGQRPTTPGEWIQLLFSVQILMTVLMYGLIAVIGGAFMRSRLQNNTIGNTKLGEHVLFSRLRARDLIWLQVTNLLAMVCTLGLYFPWARVRVLRYQFSRTGVLVAGNLEGFVAGERANVAAVGQEVGDFFDIDFGL